MSRKSRANKAELQATLTVQPEPTEAEQQPAAIVIAPTEAAPDSIPAEQDYFCCDPIEQPTPRSGSVIKAAYKKTHVLDALAQAVSDAVRGDDGKVDDALFLALSEANGIDASRWAHLNIGMQVMALTNTLRARERKGEQVFLSLEQAEEEATEAA